MVTGFSIFVLFNDKRLLSFTDHRVSAALSLLNSLMV